MNTLTYIPTLTPSWKETLATGVTQLDSKTLLIISGMLCTTSLLCVSLICLSGGQVTVTKDGISLMHPQNHMLI